MIDRQELFEALADPRAPDRVSWDEIARALANPARALGRLIPRAVIDPRDPSPSIDPAKVNLLTVGARALQRLANDSSASISDDELAAIEFLRQIVGRPAMPVVGGRCTTPPPQWSFLLDEAREVIDATTTSVGRIDRGTDHEGTGFLVARDVVMTNRHVIQPFLVAETSTLRHDHDLSVDFGRELGGGSRRHAVTEALFVSRDVAVDLALMRIADRDGSGRPPPRPLQIRSDPPGPVDRRIAYAVGFPGHDKTGQTPERVIEMIFGVDKGIKRVQPGLILRIDAVEERFQHDCSTLAGSSGSCIVDFESGLVCGLHVGGGYKRTNKAVALWRLADRPDVGRYVTG